MLSRKGKIVTFLVKTGAVKEDGEVAEFFDWKDACIDSAIFGASAFFGAIVMAFEGGVTQQEICIALTLFGGAFIAFLRLKRGIPEKV